VPIDRRAVIVAGHTNDPATAIAGLSSDDPAVRVAAIGALDRLDALTDHHLAECFVDESPLVRRRAAEAAARRTNVDLVPLLHDREPIVVEMAAWAAGEHESSDALDALIAVATTHDDALAREAAVAALGAIGDERGLPAILAATNDKPAIRRRAVIALAPFDGPEVTEALERAKADRDRHVRRAADELS
jgi:HEAT repeat protein